MSDGVTRVRGYSYFGDWVVTRMWFNDEDGTWWHTLVTVEGAVIGYVLHAAVERWPAAARSCPSGCPRTGGLRWRDWEAADDCPGEQGGAQ